jgi:hypothetical protein
MGYFKQLHIDCEPNNCYAGEIETCYMQPENEIYTGNDMQITEVIENNCPFCPKECKTAAGLSKHLNSKHHV